MLTATYSIVAISAEQKKACAVLRQLQVYIQDCLDKGEEIDPRRIEFALDMLLQFEHYRSLRKVEKLLIPAVRGSSREADGLVDELESISNRTMEMLRGIQEQLKQSFGPSVGKLRELCASLTRCCESLLKRFMREEEELLPMAMRLLSIDQWFDIGAALLSEDDGRNHRFRQPPGAGSFAI